MVGSSKGSFFFSGLVLTRASPIVGPHSRSGGDSADHDDSPCRPSGHRYDIRSTLLSITVYCRPIELPIGFAPQLGASSRTQGSTCSRHYRSALCPVGLTNQRLHTPSRDGSVGPSNDKPSSHNLYDCLVRSSE